MKPRTWIYFVKEAFKSMFRNGWMSIASIGVMAVTLFLLGSFMLLNYNMSYISDDVKSQIEIVVFLEDNIDDFEQGNLKKEIANMPETKTIKYVSKEEALHNLEMQLGEQGYLLEGYSDGDRNPLRNSFEVQGKSPENVSVLAQKIEKLQGTSRVDYGSEVVESLLAATQIINWVGLGFMVALGTSAMFLIANTIKLTVFSRREEVMIMKSVGATNWFIRWPFVIEGLMLSLAGSLLPLVGLYVGYQHVMEWTSLNVPFLQLLSTEVAFEHLVELLPILGVGVGILGSSFSIRKFLKV